MQSLSLLKNLLVDSSREVEFIDGRCLRKRLNKCDCLLCINSCPAGALSVREHQVLFDKDTCSSCMRCVAVCPNDAFSSPENDLQALIKSTSHQKHVVFTCSQQSLKYPDEHVIPCLGLFSVELLFYLGMAGPPAITFNLTGCPGCRNKASSEAFLKSLQVIERHAAGSLRAKFVVLEEADQGKTDTYDNRRYFISTLASNLASATSSQRSLKSDTSFKTTSTARRIPQKTELIRLLFEPGGNKDSELIQPLCMHQIAVSSECTLCPLCAGICPTGALKIERKKERKQLLFKSSRCSGCGLCVLFCRHNAISLNYPTISEITQNSLHLRKQESP